MPNRAPAATTSVRIQPEFRDRIKRVAERLNRLAEGDRTRTPVSQSQVIRMALDAGLSELEAQLQRLGE